MGRVDGPAVLAANYLRKEWRKRFASEEVPPLDLHRAVVTTAAMCGYSKARVDKMIQSYLEVNV